MRRIMPPVVTNGHEPRRPSSAGANANLQPAAYPQAKIWRIPDTQNRRVSNKSVPPEAGEVRGVMAQMEALLELLEGKTSRKAKEADS